MHPGSETSVGTGWRPWGILVSLSVLTAGFIAYTIAPASILPVFAGAIGRTTTEASIAISAVFLAWALLQIPGGWVLDRYDNRRLVLASGTAYLLVAAGGLAVQSFEGFLVTRLLAGGLVVFFFVGSANVLDRCLPADRHALGLGLFVTSPPIGIAIAQAAGPPLAAAYGWRAPLAAGLGLSALGLVGCLWLLRHPIVPPERVSVGQFVAALRNPAVLLVATASLCTYAVWTFLNTWMPTYGNQVLGIDLAAAGVATALVPLAGILTRPGGGWLADRLGGRVVPVILASFVLTGLLVVPLAGVRTPLGFAAVLALAGGAVNLGVGLYLVYVNRLAAAATQGTSLAVLITASQVGNLLAPVAGGWLIAEYTWTASFGFVAGLALVGGLAIVAVSRLGTGRPA